MHMTSIRTLSALLAASLLCAAAPAKAQEALRPASTGTIGGMVRDSVTGEAVIGANVVLFPGDGASPTSRPLRGTSTNKFGIYSLPGVPPGTYLLQAQSVGYARTSATVQVRAAERNVRTDVRLAPEDVRMAEIVVEAQGSGALEQLPGVVGISPAAIKNVPSVSGESDLLRTLQLLPGVAEASEISTGLYVRGGSPDQNLTLLDGVSLYNPTHLGGFLSTLNTDAINGVDLIKGPFPPEYGQRLSSVLDVTMRDGTQERVRGLAGASTIAVRGMVEGPISEDVTFMLSGRRMFLDLFYPLFYEENEVPDYGFYDISAKLSASLSSNDRLSVSGFLSRDDLGQPPGSGEVWFNVFWRNGVASARWTHIASPTVFWTLTGAWTHYNFSSRVVKDGTPINFSDLNVNSEVNDATVRWELQAAAGTDHTLQGGIEAVGHDFTTAVGDNIRTGGEVVLNELPASSMELSGYVQDRWSPSPRFSTTFGARVTWFADGDYLRAEPRLSASYALTAEVSVKAAFAAAHQFVHMVPRNEIAVPTDAWLLSNSAIPPSRIMQGSLGTEAAFDDGAYRLTVDGYYKSMEDLNEWREGADFGPGVNLEEQLTRGDGEAYGVEVFFEKRMGRLTGWIGYALAWTRRTFPELNGGRPFNPVYDRRHDITFVAVYRLGEAWEFGATWMFGSGQPYPFPTGVYTFPDPSGGGGEILIDYAEKNIYRLPAFHKLDLAFVYKFGMFQLPWQLSLNIYNAYNHSNAYAQYLSFAPDGTPTLQEVSLFPILPSIGLSVAF